MPFHHQFSIDHFAIDIKKRVRMSFEKLLERTHGVLRRKHDTCRTEQRFLAWIKPFSLFHATHARGPGWDRSIQAGSAYFLIFLKFHWT
jgi:hypothetical protein